MCLKSLKELGVVTKRHKFTAFGVKNNRRIPGLGLRISHISSEVPNGTTFQFAFSRKVWAKPEVGKTVMVELRRDGLPSMKVRLWNQGRSTEEFFMSFTFNPGTKPYRVVVLPGIVPTISEARRKRRKERKKAKRKENSQEFWPNRWE